MTGHWVHKPIGDVFHVVNGGTPKTGVSEYWGGAHQWITPAEMGGLSSPYVSESHRTLTDQGLRVGAELVPPQSIILSTRAPIGHLVINQVPMAFNQGCKGLIPSKEIETKFSYYFLLANIPVLQSLGTGATFKELSGGKLKKVIFGFPDKPEQLRIVGILDEAFDAIATAKANTQKNLLNAVEVFNQQHDMVFADQAGSSERLRLGELATFRNGVNFTKRSKGRSVQIIGVKDFQKHFWVPLNDLGTVTLDGDLSPIDTVSEGDILTVRSNGNPELIGRCMVVGSLTEPITHSGFTIRISLDRSKAAPTYVCQFLKSRAVRRKLIDGGNGLSIKSLNQGMLAEIAVPLPPLEVQHKIVAKIEALATATHELANIATRKLAALDELKKSFLHQAFTGKLTAKATDKKLEAVA